jgi:hypothetical protein
MAKKKEIPQPETSKIFDEHGDVPPKVDGISTSGAAPDSIKAAPSDTITIRLDQSGRVDVSGMRPKTTAKLKEAISRTPEMLPNSGSVEDVPDYLVALPHQLIARLEIGMASKNVPMDVAQQIFSYTPADHAVLSGPTKAVLIKYLPLLGKYQDLSGLIAAMFVVHSQKVAALQKYQQEVAERVNSATSSQASN